MDQSDLFPVPSRGQGFGSKRPVAMGNAFARRLRQAVAQPTRRKVRIDPSLVFRTDEASGRVAAGFRGPRPEEHDLSLSPDPVFALLYPDAEGPEPAAALPATPALAALAAEWAGF